MQVKCIMPLRQGINKVLVIGSGPIVIGQAAEFDYAGTQACLALKEEGIEVVLVNNNPATIMTDEHIADKVYIEPLTVPVIEEIIRKERPDGLIGTLGGQTGLNLTVALHDVGVLQKYGVAILGTNVEAIRRGEDREKFRRLMLDIGEPIPESKIIHTFAEGLEFVRTIGFPVIIRPAYTLGGTGGGFAYDEEELASVLQRGLNESPIHQVLIEKSIKGWKEIEYEVMRDENDTCLIVCNMENVDPVGVHTGDSIVVAPSQTLTDRQYQMLRSASLKIIRALGVIGGCNIQFALDPQSERYYVIEVNPRVSRSSALASKATGYPIARVAAKCALGFHLDEIKNPITGSTSASFEPALDYVVVKLPRFPFDKFTEAERELGTQMKATGEVMALDRTFEGALNKGLRSLEAGVNGLYLPAFRDEKTASLLHHVERATDLRLFAIAELFRRGFTVAEIHERSAIDPWFLERIRGIVAVEEELAVQDWEAVSPELFAHAKRMNIGDARIAEIFNVPESAVRQKRKAFGLLPAYKAVDTCAAEFAAETPYFYSTWHGADEVETSRREKILVIGSGPIRIGQGIEFDYCSVQAALAVKKKGYEAIVINNNPETVSTDYAIADRLYFEPLALEDILNVAEKEGVIGALVQFGGQTAINVARGLEAAGIRILGTSVAAIEDLEDRDRFYGLLTRLGIPHIDGAAARDESELRAHAERLGFPILVRPSYVIGGQSMVILSDAGELERYIAGSNRMSPEWWPLLVDRYVPGIECELDAVCDGEDIFVPGVFEHVEKAGVHSGDSVAVFPAHTLSEAVVRVLVDYARRIAKAAQLVGLMNIQYVVSGASVYVLEVNPRASRTVPIASKVTGVPMVEWAVAAQLGERLPQTGLLGSQKCYAVKAPVFSYEKLNGADPVLGPEMKSTGERLGVAPSLEEALDKALLAGDDHPFEAKGSDSVIFAAIAERDQTAGVPLIRALSSRGFRIAATPGTAEILRQNGVRVAAVVEEADDFRALFSGGTVQAVINTPRSGRNQATLGYAIRSFALRQGIPLFTSLDTAWAMLSLPAGGSRISVSPMKAYREGNAMLKRRSW